MTDDTDDDPELRSLVAGYYARQATDPGQSIDARRALELAEARIARRRAERRSRYVAVVLAAAAVSAIIFAGRAFWPSGTAATQGVGSDAQASFQTWDAGPAQPAKLASTPLTVYRPSGVKTAVVYFGQLRSVVTALRGEVTFNTTTGYRKAHPEECVATVVVTGAQGKQGAVYAIGMPSGWSAAEALPSQLVSTDRGVLHHQLVVPSRQSAAQPSTFTASVTVDGRTVAQTGPYVLTPAGTSGGKDLWRLSNPGAGVGSVTVSCTNGQE